MLTDLVQIRRLGEKKREENERFRRHLKRHNFVERRFRAIAQDVEEQVDCTECANCCREATVRLAGRDVEKLARYLRLKPSQFLRDYTQESEEEGLILKRTQQGCVFLDGNLCSIYESRPHNCENFPHLVRGEGSMLSRMWEFKDRACYCPIVYNTLEAFKGEVSFR
ncbi:MAG: YkgJ family cysteine cluster protein [Bryobacteraceae bacterium]